MNIQKAINIAKSSAVLTGIWFYVVKVNADDPESYDVGTEDDLNTTFHGINPRYSIGPKGEIN